jgi:hypothetical protein
MTGLTLRRPIEHDFSGLRRLHQREALMEIAAVPSALAFAEIISDCAAHG